MNAMKSLEIIWKTIKFTLQSIVAIFLGLTVLGFAFEVWDWIMGK